MVQSEKGQRGLESALEAQVQAEPAAGPVAENVGEAVSETAVEISTEPTPVEPTVEELRQLMMAAAARTDFLEAQRLKDEIDRRSTGGAESAARQEPAQTPTAQVARSRPKLASPLTPSRGYKRVRAVMLQRCVLGVQRRMIAPRWSQWRRFAAAAPGKRVVDSNALRTLPVEGSIKLQPEQVQLRVARQKRRSNSLGAKGHHAERLGRTEVAALVNSLKRRLLGSFMMRIRRNALRWAWGRWMRHALLSLPPSDESEAKSAVPGMSADLLAFLTPNREEDAKEARLELRAVARKAADRARSFLADRQRKRQPEVEKKPRARMRLYRVIEDEGICFRTAPSLHEHCRHPEEDGVDYGDVVMGAEGPPGWVRTFPERFYLPLEVEGEPALEIAKLKKAGKKRRKAAVAKPQTLLGRLRGALHKSFHDIGRGDTSSSSESEMDSDDGAGGAIESNNFADVEGARERGTSPPSVAIAKEVFRVTITDDADGKATASVSSGGAPRGSASRKRAARDSASRKRAAQIAASPKRSRVITGVVHLVPEWHYIESKKIWEVKAVAMEVHEAGAQSDPGNRRRKPRMVPVKGRLIVRYVLAGSVVQASSPRSFMVHLPGGQRRVQLECSSDVRAEWVSLTAMCSGPPSIIPVGATLRLQLQQVVAQIEEEGGMDASEERLAELHETLSRLSWAAMQVTNTARKVAEQKKEQRYCAARIKFGGYGSTTINCGLFQSMSAIKFKAVTRLVERASRAKKGRRGAGGDKKMSSKVAEYRLSLLDNDRRIACTNERLSLQTVLDKGGVETPGPGDGPLEFGLDWVRDDESAVRFQFAMPRVREQHFRGQHRHGRVEADDWETVEGKGIEDSPPTTRAPQSPLQTPSRSPPRSPERDATKAKTKRRSSIMRLWDSFRGSGKKKK